MDVNPTCSIPKHSLDLAPLNISVRASKEHSGTFGILVDVEDESGSHNRAATDENGSAEIDTWPNKIKRIVLSKSGCTSCTNDASMLAECRGEYRLVGSTIQPVIPNDP